MLTEEVKELDAAPERLHERKRRKKASKRTALIFGGCLIGLLVLISASVGLYILVDNSLRKEMEDVPVIGNVEETQITIGETYTPEELEKIREEARKEGAEEILTTLADSINNSSSLTTALRPLYKDALVVASEGSYHFVPINNELKKNTYKEENLRILDNGFVEYVENDVVISHKGIDVSKHQGEIDWAKVAADGVEFAFIRVGNRGYGSGAIVEDPQFEANVVGAITNGIEVGVYFFSQAISVEEAKEEAQFVLEKIAPYKIVCPIVLDVEKVSDSEARMNKISKEERTANTVAFLEAIEEAGYEAMLYHNMEMGVMKLDMTKLENYEKWFAYYTKELYYPYDYVIWQYSDKGKIDGINGNVDLNISFRLWSE